MTELPTTFGKYFLTEKVATGGMAEIYLAKLIGPGGFEKQLIIKQIHPALGADRHFVDLFVTEAKVLVSLTHGNIVPIYELGVVDDIYFIAMEYIDGPSLLELYEAVARQREHVPVVMATYVTAELLKGLDYAHRKGEGVIHRDLSPRNVMLSREGEVKLVDFGIAVPLDTQRTDEQSEGGLPVGSYPYMSPEQVERRSLTPQSDLFSAGVLLWEMLTGRSLFARDDPAATLQAVREAAIEAPSARRPEVPEELDRICARALARNPEERYASAGQFLGALNRHVYSREQPPTAADVSRMVARYCPPTSGRLPAHPGSDGDHGAGTVPHTPPADGDRTRPISSPSGKRRAQTRTFATNVHFEQVLATAAPRAPSQAPGDPDHEAEDETPTAGQAGPAVPAPARRAGPFLAGAVILALAGAGAALLFQGRSGGVATTSDASPAIARPVITDAAPLAAPDAAPAPADAGVPDAGPAIRRRPDAAAVRAASPGTLKVGANPWGEVYLDGQKLGRAPGVWSVAPGRHVVEVVFPVPGREQRERRTVTVESDRTTSIGVVDFTD